MKVRKLGIVTSVGMWCALVAIGAHTLYAHEGQPGEPHDGAEATLARVLGGRDATEATHAVLGCDLGVP